MRDDFHILVSTMSGSLAVWRKNMDFSTTTDEWDNESVLLSNQACRTRLRFSTL